MPEDPVIVASNVYTALLENDRVRVLEFRIRPGDKTAMHAHPDLVAITVRGGKVKFTAPNGESAEAELEDGSVMFFGATEHTTENVGTSEANGFLVELK